MTIVNKGFRGRRTESAPPAATRSTSDRGLPGPAGRTDSAASTSTTGDSPSETSSAPNTGGRGPSCSDCPASGSLSTFTASPRGPSWIPSGKAFRWTRFSNQSTPPPNSHWSVPTAATPPTSRWPIFSAARPGSSTATRANRCPPCMVARRGCWCRTCIFGSPRSGCDPSSCATATHPDSGSVWVITATATRGGNNATPGIDSWTMV